MLSIEVKNMLSIEVKNMLKIYFSKSRMPV